MAASRGNTAKRCTGSRMAPKALELLFAETLAALGAKRLRGEQNVYDFPGKDLYIMSYVDDILAVGLQDSADWFFGEFSQLCLGISESHPCANDIPFLGQVLVRDETGFTYKHPSRTCLRW